MPRSDSGGAGRATGTTLGGGGLSFEQFFAAIAGQESGGNYGAVNSRTGALGKYQILPSNIPSWSQQYLGHKITPDQFAASPALQEQLAHAVLYHYYDKYGARGAAAAWYSGSPGGASDYHRFNANEPSIGEYVDSVMQRAGAISPEQAAQSSAYHAHNATDVTTTTDATTQQTPVSELGPQAATAKPGIDGTVAPGSSAIAMPGTGALDSPGAEGVDRKMITDQVNPTQPTAATQGPTTTTTTGTHAVLDSSAPMTAARLQFIKGLESAIGTPYSWGGQGPGGFDCSGLIYWGMKQAGLKPPPRLAAQQMQMGNKVDFSALQPGDFVGWDENPNDTNGTGADHIAVYLGNNQIIEAPHTGAQVRVRDLNANDKKNGWGIDTTALYQ